MRFTTAVIAAAALAPVLAQTPGFDPITAPTADQTIPAGSSFDIIWTPSADAGTVKIVLIQGESPTTLQQGPTIASGIQNSAGKFTWTVPGNNFKTYGFNISLDNSSKFQLSNPFHISGSASSSSSSGASSTATGSPSSSGNVTAVAVPTSTALNSTYVTSTACKKCEHNATSIAIPTGNSTVSTSPTYTPVTPTGSGSNSTVLTTVVTPKPTAPSSTGGAGGSSPSATSPPATTSSSAAMAKAATGGLAAIGGLILAFAL